MAYWVERYVRAGLLTPTLEEVGGTVRRRGQTYRTTAREFVLLPGEGYTAEEIVGQRDRRRWRRLEEAIVGDTGRGASCWTLRLLLHEDGELTSEAVPVERLGDPATGPGSRALNLWLTGRLDRATLTELRAELEDVFTRYSRRAVRDKPGVPRSILHIALVRDPES